MGAAERLRAWVPRWWEGGGGAGGDVLRALAAPAEVAFRLATMARGRMYDAGIARTTHASIPVVSIGNLTVGGTGKTPVAAMIAAVLREQGRRPVVILRGYGADEVDVHRELNPGIPVEVAKRRIDAVTVAAAKGADCAVLDDGFQHRALRRDLDIVVIAAERWGQPRRLLPRGPWREPLSALQRADHLLVTRKSASPSVADHVVQEIRDFGYMGTTGVVHLGLGGLERLDAGARAAGAGAAEGAPDLAGGRFLVVTTLGDPELLLRQLRAAGAEVEPMIFPDHHEFIAADLERIRERVRLTSRALLVTRKEAVKLRGRIGADVFVVTQKVAVERGAAELDDALWRAVGEGP